MIADCACRCRELEAHIAQAPVQAPAVLPQMRALVAGVHQLADRGRRGRDHRRRQRGGEDIGPADQAHHLELGMVGDEEAADRADRLGEGADDEIDLGPRRRPPRTRRGLARRRSPCHAPRRQRSWRHASWRPRPSPSAARCRRASNRRPRARPACRLRAAAGRAACRDPRRYCGGSGRSRHCRARSRHRSRHGCRRRG